MGWVKDNVFGGAAKDAAKQQTKALEEAQNITQQAVSQARSEIMDLFPQAQQSNLAGYQSALDLFNTSAPQQMQMAQQGNQNAQATLLAGLPQMNNALLGAPIDYSALQVRNTTYNPSALNAQLPAQLQNILTPPQTAQTQQPTHNEFDAVMGGNYVQSPFTYLGGRSNPILSQLMRLK